MLPTGDWVPPDTSDGLEVNLLGLNFGINPFDASLKLPLVGRIGPERRIDTAVVTQ